MRFSFMSGMAFRIATSKKLWKKERGVAIFAKACFGHPSPSKQQKLNATANAFQNKLSQK
jgi:hypothetical protein